MMRPIAVVLAALLLLAACSSSELTVEEYAPAIEERATAYADEVDDLIEQNAVDLNSAVNRLQNDLQGDALITAAVGETAMLSSMLFAGIGDALDRYERALEALEAPVSVVDEHRSYLEALEASRRGVAPLLAALADVTTFEEIDRAIASSGFSDAQPRVEAACATLEGVIASVGTVVNLRCEVVE